MKNGRAKRKAHGDIGISMINQRFPFSTLRVVACTTVDLLMGADNLWNVQSKPVRLRVYRTAKTPPPCTNFDFFTEIAVICSSRLLSSFLWKCPTHFDRGRDETGESSLLLARTFHRTPEEDKHPVEVCKLRWDSLFFWGPIRDLSMNSLHSSVTRQRQVLPKMFAKFLLQEIPVFEPCLTF